MKSDEIERASLAAVAILPEAVQEEFVRVPADLAYWNAQYAEAFRGHLIAKYRGDTTLARLRIEHRERLLAIGSKTTESQVEAAVECDPQWAQAREDAIEAEVTKVRIAGVCEAIRAKKDMLSSLGAHLRVEMEHDPVLRERSRGRRMVEE